MSQYSGQNPANPRQRRVFFHLQDAHESGEKRHPQIVMRELAATHGFTILAAVPQSLFDGWDVWIEEPEGERVDRPYLLDYPWKPVGQV